MAVLSDYEDPGNIREAFEVGVRGYLTTSLASLVAVQAVHLVCAGGTFAPAAALLIRRPGATRRGPAARRVIEGFTQRQAQILDCLRRGMANKLIAYELSMCESTVKVHVRNIMKKAEGDQSDAGRLSDQRLLRGRRWLSLTDPTQVRAGAQRDLVPVRSDLSTARAAPAFRVRRR